MLQRGGIGMGKARNKLLFSSLCIVAAHLISGTAHAEWAFLPKNSHQLYETYALLQDNQSTLIYTGESRSRAALGSSFALIGNSDSPAHPQIVLQASINLGLRHVDNHMIEAEALDTRFALAYELALDPAYRVSAGLMHTSGHAADGEQDLELLLADYISDYQLFFRIVYDLGPYLRAGITLKPYLHSNPNMEVFAADQFVEFFPLGAADEPRKPSPYVALGLDQGGTTRFGIVNTFNAQAGFYMGNHFSNDFRQSLRVVLGYSTGADPRLKAFQLTDLRRSFGYFGLMFDL